jgi:hypothetical protein
MRVGIGFANVPPAARADLDEAKRLADLGVTRMVVSAAVASSMRPGGRRVAAARNGRHAASTASRSSRIVGLTGST